MKIKNPFVEVFEADSNIELVANCASICYGNTKAENPEKLYLNLIAKGHVSMLRHETHYYIIPIKVYIDIHHSGFNFKKVGIDICYSTNTVYVVTNGQFNYEHKEFIHLIENYEVDKLMFQNIDIDSVKEMVRITLHLGASIATIREFNRVSPNNIAERSTRFCNYTKNKFGNDITVDTPFFMPRIPKEYDNLDKEKYVQHCIDNGHKDFNYINSLERICSEYGKLIKETGCNTEVARNLLPLATYSEVIYTYNIKEWRNIINLRYYGITGKPNPDAEFLGYLVKEVLSDFGYNFPNPKENEIF